MKEIKKIDPFSLAKFMATYMFVIGALAAIMISVIQSFTIGIVMLIVYPLLGFVSGLIFGFIYNLYAETFGGIKIELK